MNYRHLLLSILLTSSAASAQVRLKIIHWNDFHAQNAPLELRTESGIKRVGGLAHFKPVVDSLRRSAQARGIPVLALDAGDNFQGTPISGLTKGASQIEAVNMLMPDAAVLGNHEFDYSAGTLKTNLKKAKYKVIAANLFEQKGGRFVSPYIIRDMKGIRVAIIGLITDNLRGVTLPKNLEGIIVVRCNEALRATLPEVKQKKPDVIIVLSHVGVDLDKVLAKQFPEVDVFVGGHSHTPLFSPIKQRESIIVQAGSRGEYVGELDLVVDTKGDSILSSSGKLLQVMSDRITPDSAAAAFVNRMERRVQKEYGEIIGRCTEDWGEANENKHTLALWEAAMFRTHFNTDIGIINNGGIRKPMPKGTITIKDMLEINPFGNQMIRFTLTGADLKSALTNLYSKSKEKCELSGITCRITKKGTKGKNTVTDIRIGGNPINLKKRYSIATNEFVASQFEKIFGLDQSKTEFVETGESDLDALTEAVRTRKLIRASDADARWFREE